MNVLENYFKLKENNSKLSTEALAGLTTFVTMVYILAVNPQILSATGMDTGALFTATALMCIIGSATMGLLAKYPYALAPGMGLNAFFAYAVAAEVGWQGGLLLLFIQGLIFMLMALARFREAIFKAVPQNMKYAIGVGIGLFITHIGFQNAGFVVHHPATIVGVGDIRNPTSLLFLLGCIISIALIKLNFKGGIFLGILITYGLGLLAQFAGLYIPGLHGYSLIPEGIVSLPPSIAPISLISNWRDISFLNLSVFTIISLILILLFVEALETVATLIGVSERASFLDKKGNLPRLGRALFSDASTTTIGAILGTSTTTTYIESATGIQAGGRTGLTALFVAGFFLIAMFFWPLFAVIPAFATAPALVIVGLYMAKTVVKIDFDDFSEAFPAFLVVVLMPLTFSISDGLVYGVICYVIIKLLTGKARTVSWVMYLLALIFVLKLLLN